MDDHAADDLTQQAEDEPALDYASLTQQAILEDNALVEEEVRRLAAATPTAEQKAQRLKEYAGASFLYGLDIKVFGHDYDTQTHKVFLDAYLKDAGAPSDPVERMLLEQLLLAHHALGRLHIRAGSSPSMEEATAASVGVAKLMAEFRRTALALQSYREVASKSSATREKTRPRKEPTAVNGHAADLPPKTADSEEGSENRSNGYFHASELAIA
jgi:hypothetical protein